MVLSHMTWPMSVWSIILGMNHSLTFLWVLPWPFHFTANRAIWLGQARPSTM